MDGRLHSRVRAALLLAFAVSVAVVPVPAAADIPGDIPADVVATPAAAPSIVSSFAPVFEDRTVVAGTQEITVVAPATGSTGVLVPLGPAPCACDIASVDATAGVVSGSTWDVGELGPSASASIVVVWTHSG